MTAQITPRTLQEIAQMYRRVLEAASGMMIAPLLRHQVDDAANGVGPEVDYTQPLLDFLQKREESLPEILGIVGGSHVALFRSLHSPDESEPVHIAEDRVLVARILLFRAEHIFAERTEFEDDLEQERAAARSKLTEREQQILGIVPTEEELRRKYLSTPI